MKSVFRFWKVIIIDVLGIVFMIAALLTGWLPGPGGIPLLIIGLSLLAINHEWAQRYIDKLKNYADHVGDLIFIEKPKVQLIYDLIAPIMIASGILLLIRHSAIWMISLGIFITALGITFLLGNRHRYRNIKRKIAKKN